MNIVIIVLCVFAVLFLVGALVAEGAHGFGVCALVAIFFAVIAAVLRFAAMYD